MTNETDAPTEVMGHSGAILVARDLVLKTEAELGDIEITAPFTLLHTRRESSATSTMLTLAGRMQPKQGVLELKTAEGVVDKPRAQAKLIALAGVNEIDSLDRNVTVQSLVREAAAWASPWWRRTPHDIDRIARWGELREQLGITAPGNAQVGQLEPAERFLLRIALALLTRQSPAMLFVDDVDQVHSLEIRREIVGRLQRLSSELPVVVSSSNDDIDRLFDAVLTLPGRKDAL